MLYYRTDDNKFYIFKDIKDDKKEQKQFIEQKIKELNLIETTKEYIENYNSQIEKTERAKYEIERDNLLNFLRSTDYIGRKLAEKLALNENVEEFLNEKSETFSKTHKEIIIEAKEARNKINSINKILSENPMLAQND